MDLKIQRDNDAGGQLLLSLLLSAHNRMVKYLEIVFELPIRKGRIYYKGKRRANVWTNDSK